MVICAEVTDESDISWAKIRVQEIGVDPLDDFQVEMFLTENDTYCREFSSITSYPFDGKSFYYWISAKDIFENVGSHKVETFTFDCENPTAEANEPYDGDEGTYVSLTGTGSDSVTPENQLVYSWDLDNDGIYETVEQNPNFYCADDGVYTVGLQVTDNAGFVATDSATITCNNVAPEVSAGGPYNVLEGSSVTLIGDADDVPADILTYEWDLDNDGETYETPGQEASFYCPEDGEYFVNLKVTDDDGGIGYDSATIVCENVAPSINDLTATTPINEEEISYLFATVSDVGGDDIEFSYTIAWGDGDTITGTTNETINEEHQYLDNGVFTITLTVSDSDFDEDSETFEVIVNNLDPWNLVITGSEKTTEGEKICFSGSAEDVAADTLSYSWDFGTEEVSVLEEANCFIYNERGTYNVTLTVTDEDGGESNTYLEVGVFDYSIGMNAGWNLFSIPLVPEDNSLDYVLNEEVSSNAESVWGYQYDELAGRNVWSYNEPNEESTGWKSGESRLQKIIPGYGYYIKLLDNVELFNNGEKMYEQGALAYPPSVKLTSGWNLIGHYGMKQSVAKEDALTSLSGAYTTLLNEEGTIIPEFNPTKGYWLFVTSQSSLEYAPSESAYQ